MLLVRFVYLWILLHVIYNHFDFQTMTKTSNRRANFCVVRPCFLKKSTGRSDIFSFQVDFVVVFLHWQSVNMYISRVLFAYCYYFCSEFKALIIRNHPMVFSLLCRNVSLLNFKELSFLGKVRELSVPSRPS